jgi:energy-coupling factor transporter transmembrane protein EcfT
MKDVNDRQASTRSGKKFIRTFLFSMRLGAPLSRVHFITKFAAVLLLSFVIIQAMDEQNPDPVLTLFFFGLSLLALILGGVSRWIFRSYMVLIFPMFFFLFLTWVAFSPDPGTRVYFQYPLYTGAIKVGISVASAAFLFVLILHYSLTKKILRGFFIAMVIALLIANYTPNPGLTLTTIPFLKPYTFMLSDENFLVAATKVIGYAAMVFNTLLLVMTTRDNELTAALYQLKTPKFVRFFLSIVFRTLNMSLLDFETIRHAQIARGVRIREQGIFSLLRNTAKMAIPLVASMFQRSNEIGDALLARGFSFQRAGREFLEVQPLTFLDWLLLLLVVAYILLFYLFPHNLYALLVDTPL